MIIVCDVVEWQIQSTHLTRSRHRYLLRSFMQTSVNKCEEKKRAALGTARECVNYSATSERTSASNFTKEKRMWISWLCCIATASSVRLIVCWNVGSRAAGNLHNHSGTDMQYMQLIEIVSWWMKCSVNARTFSASMQFTPNGRPIHWVLFAGGKLCEIFFSLTK